MWRTLKVRVDPNKRGAVKGDDCESWNNFSGSKKLCTGTSPCTKNGYQLLAQKKPIYFFPFSPFVTFTSLFFSFSSE